MQTDDVKKPNGRKLIELIQTPRGTQNLLPVVLEKWRHVENVFRKTVQAYQFGEISTPTFESAELFERTSGEGSDIVSKEMYIFQDRGGRELALRPEGTAPVVRAYLQHKMFALPQPVKLFYFMPMFRYERPQAGRFRQHHQYGVEVIGEDSPLVDAEVISLAINFYKSLGISGPLVHINSIGDAKCRPAYRAKLVEFLKKIGSKLCEDCQTRMDRNPLRVLDCKNPGCQAHLNNAPLMVDTLCSDCRDHFQRVRKFLDGAQIPNQLNPRLVRGLDYYTRTVFEVTAKDVSTQEVLSGGGRYDGLAELLGGPSVPAMGFGGGMERLIQTMEKQGAKFPHCAGPDVFIVAIGDAARQEVLSLAVRLRNEGISTELEYHGASFKSQLSKAAKLEARITVIVGEDEINRGVIGIREMASRQQIEIPWDDAVAWIKNAARRAH